jgi:anti-sigma B factor antagonist
MQAVLNSSAVTQVLVVKREARQMPVTQVAMTLDSNLEISIDQVGKDFVVRPSGQINVYSSPDLRDSLQALLSKEPSPQTVTVDLASVSSIETSGVATLIEALRIARHRHVAFCLQGAGGSVFRLFEVTGVLSLFDLAGSREKVS